MTRNHVLLDDHGYPLIWQRPSRLERLASRADRVIERAMWVVLWLGTAYVMAHVLVLAGVAQ